jgi:transcription-repair coupling factor (superfamily II helicase)
LNLSSLLALLKEIPAYREVSDALADSAPRLTETPLGVLSAARPTVLAALHAHTQRPTLVIVARADRARELARQIRAWSPHPAAVLRLPDPDALPYERVAWGRDTVRERVSALAALLNSAPNGCLRPTFTLDSAL